MIKPILFIVLASVALSSAQLANVPQRLRTSRKVETVTLIASEMGRNLLGNIEPDLRGKETFGEDIAELSMSMSMSMISDIEPSAAPTAAVPVTLVPSVAPTASAEEDEDRWICTFCPVYVCRSCASD